MRASVTSRLDSNVVAYSRRWPVVFAHAKGALLRDEDGTEYLDFFAGAGTLNYGHNPPLLIEAAIEYLRSGGPLSTLDMATTARNAFLETFATLILEPRQLDYRVQFTSPSGSSAVEAALRLARKVTSRRRVISFTGGYHGMTLDAISVSDAKSVAGRPSISASDYTVVSHELDVGPEDFAFQLGNAFASGEPPAALIVETTQAEGGVRPFSGAHLHRMETLCRAAGALFIVDDIQAGCGRTGPFFSFEPAGVHPHLVCLSKSIGAVGLPMSLLLVEPACDVWEPGEHSGTFRGNDLAFVTGTVGLQHWWSDGELSSEVERKSQRLLTMLAPLASESGLLGAPRGRGLLVGLPCEDKDTADRLSLAAFQRGLLVETCGHGTVVKLIPPLIVSNDEIDRAVAILGEAARSL